MNNSVIVIFVAIVVDGLSFLFTRSHIELMSLLSIVFLAFAIFLLSLEMCEVGFKHGLC